MSAHELIEDYFDTRLPEELEPYRQLVLATDIIAQRALSNEVVTPGVTRAIDIKWFFDQQIASLGVGGKPWFEIHTAVQRFDPATGKAIPYLHPAPDTLTFQRGDIIHLDCGFDYLGVVIDLVPRDVQRHPRRQTGELVHPSRVGDLLLDGAGVPGDPNTLNRVPELP